MDNKDNKRGFSGLSDLASEVGGIGESRDTEPNAKGEHHGCKQPPQTHGETSAVKPEREEETSPQLIKTASTGKSGGGSGGKWIMGIIGVVFVIWLINNGGLNNKKPSYNPPSSSQSYSYPQSTPAPAVQTPSAPQTAGLQYTKPSVGTNNVLSVPEIRWCIREGIRIEAMRDAIDTNEGIDKFNRIVHDYNSRCGSYRYHQGSRLSAERDVEPYRNKIVSEAIQEARQLDSRSYQLTTSSAPKKPGAQFTREAQQLLTDLGYDPGPVDGDYGPRTAEAVKAFQRETGLNQDGWIDRDFLTAIRKSAMENRKETSPKKNDNRSESNSPTKPYDTKRVIEGPGVTRSELHLINIYCQKVSSTQNDEATCIKQEIEKLSQTRAQQDFTGN